MTKPDEIAPHQLHEITGGGVPFWPGVPMGGAIRQSLGMLFQELKKSLQRRL